MKKRLLQMLFPAMLTILCVFVYFHFNYPNIDKNHQLTYNGHTYAYNKDLINILFLGVDQRGELIDNGVVGKGGQSDTIILLSLNKKSKQLNVFSINRDSMIPVERHDNTGAYYDEQVMQLCLQYAYGKTHEESSTLVQNKIQKLLKDIPIEGYMTTNLDAIVFVNDTLGGVPVTLEEDMSYYNPDMVPGATVTLTGESALEYIRDRLITNISNTERLERQKKYISAFIPVAKAAIKNNPSLIAYLYDNLRPYIRTNLDYKQMAELAIAGLQCEIENISLNTIPGTVVDGGQYWEYEIDYPALNQLIIDSFFIRVK